ncbi:uncharacterized protein DEA37_0011753 [Paragonimus westermani]|uniref:FMRFamide-activated amiloride-sensitive sodium channel n=1 Tax=Paragonimus westermani TaxID=34504 RepID=A0A5J4NNF8_9TREM|nr:uncharacterized protein DEA37_0011753 [Paragonimus westermani]
MSSIPTNIDECEGENNKRTRHHLHFHHKSCQLPSERLFREWQAKRRHNSKSKATPKTIDRKHICPKNMTAKQIKRKSFGDISSLRGIQNIFRAETPFIRSLWILFVISMTCVLAVSSYFLIVDFLSYKTAWYERIIPDQKTAFPSITLCAHNPFSLEANRLWELGHVPSPKHLKSTYARLTIQMLRRGDVAFGEEISFWDTIENYYSNLHAHQAFRVGHTYEMFPYCIFFHEGSVLVADKCDLEKEQTVHRRRFSHPKYFNCWTIEGQVGATTDDLMRLIILVHLVPSKDIVQANSSFVMDTFTRGEGIKVVVHERGTYPEIEKDGFNIQPSRMNEVIYKTVQWNRLPTPVAPCVENMDPIYDLGINYTYSDLKCFDKILQHELLSKCKCLHTEWPRPVSSDDIFNTVPYCTTVLQNASDDEVAANLAERFKCSSDVLSRIKEIKNTARSQGRCLPLCNYFTYDAKLNVMLWDPSPQRLTSYEQHYRQISKFESQEKTEESMDELITHMNRSVHDEAQDESSAGLKFGNNGEFGDGTFTYISLIRQSMDTILKEERRCISKLNIMEDPRDGIYRTLKFAV